MDSATISTIFSTGYGSVNTMISANIIKVLAVVVMVFAVIYVVKLTQKFIHRSSKNYEAYRPHFKDFN